MISICECALQVLGRIGERMFVKPEEPAVGYVPLQNSEACHQHSGDRHPLHQPSTIADTAHALKQHSQNDSIGQKHPDRVSGFNGCKTQRRPMLWCPCRLSLRPNRQQPRVLAGELRHRFSRLRLQLVKHDSQAGQQRKFEPRNKIAAASHGRIDSPDNTQQQRAGD